MRIQQYLCNLGVDIVGGWKPGEAQRLLEKEQIEKEQIVATATLREERAIKEFRARAKPRPVRICADCGCPIMNRHATAKRCAECATRRERNQAKERLKNGKHRNYNANVAFKKAAQAAQGDICILCGWTLEGIAYGGCVAHHIIAVTDGGSEEVNNAAMLCPNCHAKAHYNLISEDDLKVAVMKAVDKHLGCGFKDRLDNLRYIIDMTRSGKKRL